MGGNAILTLGRDGKALREDKGMRAAAVMGLFICIKRDQAFSTFQPPLFGIRRRKEMDSIYFRF